jgi:hypothetical protein
MNMKLFARALAITALSATLAMCENDDLEDETQDVIDAQQEAVDVADDNPQDTAAIRDAGEEVEEEQREAAAAMREELKEKGLDTLQSTTRE